MNAFEGLNFKRTTEGMNGGVIFLAIRSSQLIGEKKEWNLSSSCRGGKTMETSGEKKNQNKSKSSRGVLQVQF